MTTSANVREGLVRTLRLDLVGPEPVGPHDQETLPQPPSRWYLTGFLVPYEPMEKKKRRDRSENEEVDLLGPSSGGDDEASPDQASGRRAFFPSSIGVSVLVGREVENLDVTVQWGDYKLVENGGGGEGGEKGGTSIRSRSQWKRTPRSVDVKVPVGKPRPKPIQVDVPGSDGLKIVTSVRHLTAQAGDVDGGLPAGARSVSIFLVNQRDPRPDEREDEGMTFQTTLVINSKPGFLARPNVRGLALDDPDERVADLQYQDVCEYAVGHGVATAAVCGADGTCPAVRTTWIPLASVEKVEPARIEGVELRMEELAAVGTAADLRGKLEGLSARYGEWIEAQKKAVPAERRRAEVARDLLRRAAIAKGRIQDGLALLEKDPLAFESFKIANRAMAAAARQREARNRQKAPAEVDPPAWRPFQLAFILLNLRGIADGKHEDRGAVDLLFFPTGGGKTEAYLGLAAFTIVLRRLRTPGLASAGVSVLMRYTLRLLTLDQLMRASALICALELERKKDNRLGEWPFEIGLWVGLAATPNEMGQKGDKRDNTARARTIAFQNDDRKPSPIPLEECPWCGTKFRSTSFLLLPKEDYPKDLRIVCTSRACPFKGVNPLPVLAVDEPIYRRLPCFLIATIDKFAALPWVGRVGSLLGLVDRADREGFYGPCDTGGRKLEKPLLPPDLIIQDELHLISGPLGTIAGLYEGAIDQLSTRVVDGKEVRPKIVASTATVRRAETQIRALFGRTQVEMFPPPGPDRRNSFFALTVPPEKKNPRNYIGIAAQGRSLKVVLLRTYLALLAAAARAYIDEGGDKNVDNPADPYMSLLGYFNSLRELGGARRIVEDEVNSRLTAFSKRVRMGETKGPFADREIKYEVVELTSRVGTSKVAEARRHLQLAFREKDHVDVALATNMISVGLDIPRLGLMVVLGQPKTTAEYIQATSRVGRDDTRPGLVVTLLNIHRPRDRSHYERFECYHESFYRGVEATSVTPFSPRAIDRTIAAVTVALARLGCSDLTAPLDAVQIGNHRAKLVYVAETLSKRAEMHDGRLTPPEAGRLRQKLLAQVKDLLDEWQKIATLKQGTGAGLQYQREVGSAPPLLFTPLDPALADQPPGARKFRANRSMRDVEQSVNLWVHRLDNIEVPSEDQAP